MTNTIEAIEPALARAFLAGNREQNLLLLGALVYDPLQAVIGLRTAASVRALALIVDLFNDPHQSRPSVLLAATDADALEALLAGGAWPREGSWMGSQPELLGVVERYLGRTHDPLRGLLYYIATRPIHLRHPLVRRLTLDDADALDLEPCHLSAIALRNWIYRGWRVFGAVAGRVLLAHALAAYPIDDIEEVSAVFTAPQMRRRGLARAVAAAAVDDIVARGRRAVYVTRRANAGSRAVAVSLELSLCAEAWAIPSANDEPIVAGC